MTKEQTWLDIVIKAIAAIGIPLVLLSIGNDFTSSLKEREVRHELVKVAVGILQQEPKPETEDLRRWAAQVVNDYSGVPLGSAQEQLVNNLALPEFQPTQALPPTGEPSPSP